jgi:outer membrane protein assembly factor BamD
LSKENIRMRKIFFIILMSLAVLFTSCSEFQKALKSKDYEYKYERALYYFEQDDWYRSQSLINDVLPVYRGTAKAKKLYYMKAYTHYNQAEYILGAYHFRNFIKTYPNDELTRECEFMLAECFRHESPRFNLDQQNTKKAIQGYQMFINKYPKSEKVELANIRIGELHDRLETKSFENSRLYYQLRDYKAAAIALKNTLREFPDTEYREDLLYLVMKSNFLLAENSIKKIQKERYQETIDSYYVFIDEFPESENAKEAEKIFEVSVEEIKK